MAFEQERYQDARYQMAADLVRDGQADAVAGFASEDMKALLDEAKRKVSTSIEA